MAVFLSAIKTFYRRIPGITVRVSVRPSAGWPRLEAIMRQLDDKSKVPGDASSSGEEEVIDIDSDLLFLSKEAASDEKDKSSLTPGSTDPSVIKEEVARSIEAHAPEIPYADEDELTPAQIFYMENRERLLAQAQSHLLNKRTAMNEYEWSYSHEPVVKPPKGHLWSMQDDDAGPRESYALDWPKHQLPTVDMIVELLRAEEARDIVVVDLNECERRDLGSHAIVCTGNTSRHSRRLGNLVAKTVLELDVAHVACYSYGTRNDTWVLARVGPICIHLFTPETRPMYQLELLYQEPNKFFQPGDFPHYPLDDLPFDARIGEIRSYSAMLRPFDDSLHEKFLLEEGDDQSEKD